MDGRGLNVSCHPLRNALLVIPKGGDPLGGLRVWSTLENVANSSLQGNGDCRSNQLRRAACCRKTLSFLRPMSPVRAIPRSVSPWRIRTKI